MNAKWILLGILREREEREKRKTQEKMLEVVRECLSPEECERVSRIMKFRCPDKIQN